MILIILLQNAYYCFILERLSWSYSLFTKSCILYPESLFSMQFLLSYDIIKKSDDGWERCAMQKKILFIILLILLFPIITYGQNEIPKHEIDVWFDKAMDKCDGSTHTINSLYFEGAKKWDSELNRVYKRLMTLLNSEGKKALKETQIKWIQYKETKNKNMWNIFGGGVGCGGTMDSISVNAIIYNTVKTRTDELLNLLELAEMNVEEVEGD